MISVIVCSINKTLAEQVERSIHETIGVPWELILIDNNELKKSIAHVYNRGAEQAKYDIVCFVHEDVIFRTASWGKVLLSYFNNDPRLGLIGVAGSKYKSKTPSGWWTGLTSMDCCNILFDSGTSGEGRVYLNPDASVKLQAVTSIDGVFMCARRSVWNQIRFNEHLVGFHFYDIDFSVALSKKYTAAVSFEIDLLHLSRYGSFNKTWVYYALQWHRSHAGQLPAYINSVAASERAETLVCRNWLYRLRFEKLGFFYRLRWIVEAGALKKIQLWPHIAVFIFPRASRSVASIFRKSQ